jgi:hypothetical protein
VLLYHSRDVSPVLENRHELAPERYPELRRAGQMLGREAWLGEALAEEPRLLLIDRIDPEAGKPMLLGRQIGLADRGTLDLVFLEATGIVTVVETKLAKNREARREVFAQILDYGGYLARRSFGDLEALAFPADQRADQGRGSDLAAAVWRFAGHGDPQGERYATWVDRFKRTVEENLWHRRLRLIIAADQIDPRLRDMLEFMVGGTRPEFQIALVEVTPYRLPDPGSRMLLVPSLHWCWAPPIRPLELPSERVRWTEDTFLAQTRFNLAQDKGTIDMVEDILHWMNRRVRDLHPRARLEYSTTPPNRPAVNLYLQGFKYALPHLEGGTSQLGQQGWFSLDDEVWQTHGPALRAFFTRLKALGPCADLAELRLTGETNNGDAAVRQEFLAAIAELQDAILGKRP